MKQTLLNNGSCLAGLIGLLLAMPINATNFAYYSHGAIADELADWDGEVGTSDGGATAWTYVSFYNFSNAALYVEMETSYSTTSSNPPFTIVESYGPAYLSDQDTGTLWNSSTVYCGRSIAQRLNPSNNSVIYLGAWGYCSQGPLPSLPW